MMLSAVLRVGAAGNEESKAAIMENGSSMSFFPLEIRAAYFLRTGCTPYYRDQLLCMVRVVFCSPATTVFSAIAQGG